MNNRVLDRPVSKEEVNYELSTSRARGRGNLIVAIPMCFLAVSVTSKAALPLPYGLMAKAAVSDESLSSQARSEVIKTKWKAKLVAADGPNDLRLKTYVLMQRGFVVGFVDSESRENEIKEISGSVGLRSLDCYLPRRGKTAQVSESALQPQGPESRTTAFLVKLQIKAALAQHGLREPLKVDVVVLNDTAVLVGIVDNEQERATVLAAAKNTKPIQQVVDFLLLPEPGYEKLLRLP